MTPQLIDIGVNLSNKAFAKDREQVLERAIHAGVTQMILTGTSLPESYQVLELSHQYSDYCRCTAGVHPHDAKEVKPEHINELRALLKEDKAVAVGEAGLDFNRDFSPRPVQEQVFEPQVELAIESGLPLFCHERDASERLADIIKCMIARHTGKTGAQVAQETTDTPRCFLIFRIKVHNNIRIRK